jgi:RNA recognition motif-containing protein
MNIYIANLSYDVTDEDLKELFSNYGTINSVKVIIDKETGKSKGFGFVEMPNDEEGMKAIEDLNGQKLLFDGEEDSAEAKEVKVSVARPRQQQTQSQPQRNFRPNNGYQPRNRQPYYGNQGGYRPNQGQSFRPRRQYGQGYNQGYGNQGYNQGYSHSYNQGYNPGYNQGYGNPQENNGQEPSVQTNNTYRPNQGYNQGYNPGYQQGGFRPRRPYQQGNSYRPYNNNNGYRPYNNNNGYGNQAYNNQGYSNYNQPQTEVQTEKTDEKLQNDDQN